MHRAALIVVMLAGCASQTPAPEPPRQPWGPDAGPRIHARTVTCQEAATTFGPQAVVGGQIAIACPPGCTAATVWGTDIYTSDSAMCVAAVHANAATAAAGGDVLVEILGPQDFYAASVRNGVSTSTWNHWDLSFRVRSLAGANVDHDGEVGDLPVKQPPPARGNTLTCATTAANLAGGAGSQHDYLCPPGCLTGSVWGTTIYTDDSAICVAAVHAGVASVMGGPIVLTILPGLPSYQASLAHGVTTGTWGAWQRSYRVDRR